MWDVQWFKSNGRQRNNRSQLVTVDDGRDGLTDIEGPMHNIYLHLIGREWNAIASIMFQFIFCSPEVPFKLHSD